jgi:acyl dehydratase
LYAEYNGRQHWFPHTIAALQPRLAVSSIGGADAAKPWANNHHGGEMLASTRQLGCIAELKTRVGEQLGVIDWHDVTQSEIDAVRNVTGDRQWVHTERALPTPVGGTIAHGYYTLSLAPALLGQVMTLDGFSLAVNYGLQRLRFPAPLPVGDRVRMWATLDGVDEIPGGAARTLTFERAAGDKPVCVPEAVYRVFEEQVL